MPLTNAERQKRYRDRLRAAARQDGYRSTKEGLPLGAILRAEFTKAGLSLLECVDSEKGDETIRGALREYLRVKLTQAAMVRIMRTAGERAATDILQLHMGEWYERRRVAAGS